MKTNSAVLLLAGVLSATVVSAQTQIIISTPATPGAQLLVGVDAPSGLSLTQGVGASVIGTNAIASNNVLVVGWTLTSAATNVAITADIGGTSVTTAYLTNQIGTGTTASNETAHTNVVGSASQPTTIFTGLNLAAGTYYLTLTSAVTTPNPWYSVNSSPGPTITNQAGGVTGLYQGVSTSPAPYPPASTFTSQTGLQQTGSPSWRANLFEVFAVQNVSLPAATEGTPYSVQFTATGGAGTITWSNPGGSLPPGVTLNSSSGLLSGTPTARGTYNFAVQATDARSNFSQSTPTLAVNISGKVITTNLPAGMAIINISGTQDGAGAFGGDATQPLWYQPFSNVSQLVEYTIQPGTYTFRAISPTDAAYTFPALTGPQLNSMWTAWTYNTPWIDDYLVFDSSAVSNPTESQLFSGAGGVPNDGVNSLNATTAYNWVTANGNYNNVYVGNREAAPEKTYTFPIPRTLIFSIPDNNVSDNAGGVSLLIAPVSAAPLTINTTSLFNGQVGVVYSQTTFSASGGYGPPYVWSASGLPPGLTISPAGVLSGTPTHVGPYTVFFTVTDPVSGSSFTQTTPFHLNMAAASPVLSISTTTLPQGEINVTYDRTISATGGFGAYSWSMTAVGTPPLSINPATGEITSSGPLTCCNDASFDVTVTDAAGETAPKTYTLLLDGHVSVSTTLTAATAGQAYSAQLTASGGTAIYTNWAVTNGFTLPAGLGLSSTGILSGTPTTAGPATVNVTVTDSANGTASAAVPLQILPANPSISTTLPAATAGESYGVQLAATGGSGNYTNWAVTNGFTLPIGLNLSSTGFLSGTPTTAGSPSVNVTVTDSASGTASAALPLQIILPVSYVAVNQSLNGGTVTISPNGASESQIAAATGREAVLDNSGNYILAQGTTLERVTPTGNMSAFGTAPSGSTWAAVAVDGLGNYIVGDNQLHAVWRLSPDGAYRQLVAQYPVSSPGENEDVHVLVDVHGNYIIGEDNNAFTSTLPRVSLFSITPAGTVSQLTLTGETLPVTANGLAFDRNGNYMLLDNNSGVVFQMTPQGAVTVFATGFTSNAGLVRNPVTNDYYSGSFTALLKLSADGAHVTIFGQNQSLVPNPQAVLAIPTDFPSAVEATNPLGYFRMETPSGTSEVNGYTYTTKGGATISNPGAPLGNPANNAVALDGFSGYVSTNLAGNIGTAGSVMAWMKMSVLPSSSEESNNYIAGESTNGNDFDLQFDNTNILRFYTTNNNANLGYTPDPTTLVGQWHMVVATFDATAGTRAIYWDGSLVASDNTVSIANKPGVFQIGSSPVFPSRNFNGSIDEAAVWNYSLTPGQVYAMYASAAASSNTYISTVTPSSVQNSAADTTVTINGNNLQQGSTVWFTPEGGATTLLTPTTVAANQVTVTIPAAQLITAGVAQMSVANAAGIPTNQIPFTVAANGLSIGPGSTTLSSGQVGHVYSAAFSGSGGSLNYSWLITGQATGFNMVLSPSTGAQTTISGTPTASNTDGGLNVRIQLTDTETGQTVSKTYFAPIGTAPVNTGPVFGTEPSNTTAYVLNDEDGTIVSVTNGVPSPFVSSPGSCQGCFGSDLARDAAGNFIVAAGAQLSRYTAAGASLSSIPATLKGSYFASVAVDSQGNYIVADIGLHQVEVMTSGGSLTATYSYSSTISSPDELEDAYVRVDSAGNYILIEDNTESNTDPVLLFIITPGVTPTGTPLTPVTLTASRGNYLPTTTGGFTFDAQGNYVNVDWYTELVSTITPGGTVTNLYFDDGNLLSDPFGIARDPLSGDFFIADDDNDELFTLTSNGSALTPIASGGLLTSAGPVVVSNATQPPPTLVTWVLEGSNYIVPVGGGTTINCPPTTCNNGANDFAVDAAGNFILAAGNLVKVTQAGVSSVIAAQPDGSQFLSVAVDSSGNYIVADDGLHRIVKVTPAGVISRIANYPTSDGSESPEDVFVRIDGAGNYIVAEDSGSAVVIHRITTAGNVTNVTVSGTDPVGISGLALDANGNYLISDFVNRVIDVITPAGAGTLLYANGNETLAFPSGMYRDPSSGNILITDETHSGLYSLTPNGVTLTQISSGLGGAASVLIAAANVAPLSITTTALPSGTQGSLYSTGLAATGGSGNYTWSATGLPPGVTLSATGILSGTATASGSFTAAVTVTDALNTSATATANLAVLIGAPAVAPPPPTTPTLTLSSSSGSVSTTVGGSVAVTFTASNGTAPYSYTVNGQPAGVSVGAGGALSGSPTLAGNFTATVTVKDSGGATASASVGINVLGLTTTSLPAGTAGQFYSASITAIGGASSYTFTATGIPAGLSLSGTGLLSGTVKTNGSYTLPVTVSSSGVSVSGPVSVTFATPKPLAISNATLPDATVNVLFAKSFGATGGFPPYTWSVISGTLPQGLSMNSAGSVSGAATTPGPGSFGIQVADSAGATASASASIKVDPAPLSITTQALPSGMVNIDYPQQILGATGGVSPYTWSLSGGGLAAGVSLSASGVVSGVPTAVGSFTPGITVTDSVGSKATINPGLIIRAGSADLAVTVGSLGFSLMTPASTLPSSQPVGVQSTVPTQVLTYSVTVSSSAAWLSVTHGTSTPDTMQVSITAAALSLIPGNYQATITATCTSSACAGHTQSILVALNVTAAAPNLQVGTTLLSFATTTSNTGAIGQSISLQNAGGGSIGFASMTCEDAWCTVGAPPALTGGASAAVPVTVDPSLLKPGFYRTQVDIATSAGKASVPVTLFIAPNSTMTLAPAGNQFNMPAGSAPGNPNGTFLVSVNNATPVNWTASVAATSPSFVPSWLVLNTLSGTSTNAQPASIAFSIDPVAAAALAPGAYYGLIQVVSGDIANSPLDFEVVLNVVPATTPIVPDPEPGGLLFITTVGGVVPPQTINVYSGSVTPLTFQTSAAVTPGTTSWLAVTPSTGSASAGLPGVTTATVSTAGLKSGIYTGGISYALSATAVRTVNVTLIVVNPGGAATPSSVTRVNQPKALTCAPTALAPAQTGLVNNFSEPAAWPTPLVIQLSDDCGSAINNGQIVATFTNGDPPLILQLADPSKALYSGTWSPRKAASQVAINIRASAPGYPDATAQIAGAVVPNAAPILTPHGTLHSFDPLIGGALAPGTIVAIYGQNLASLTTQPTTIPLPTVANGTTVLMGGLPAPLYYVSAGQINAQIPFELLPGQQYQVLVSANGALTTPDTIQLSAAAPGLAAFGDGTLIAQHGDGSLVSTTSPAVPGEYLVAYLAGLGDTNVNLTSGAASPSSPLAIPTDTPALNINGGQYPLLFAGLTPGLVGLYQMNFQVPAGLPAGTITIALLQGGASSNQTTLPYQP